MFANIERLLALIHDKLNNLFHRADLAHLYVYLRHMEHRMTTRIDQLAAAIQAQGASVDALVTAEQAQTVALQALTAADTTLTSTIATENANIEKAIADLTNGTGGSDDPRLQAFIDAINGSTTRITDATTAVSAATAQVSTASQATTDAVTSAQAENDRLVAALPADAPPTNLNVNPVFGEVGSAVTLTGIGFGDNANGTALVTFNGTSATIVDFNDTTVDVTVPDGATSGPVVLTANGQTFTSPSFTVGSAPADISLPRTAAQANLPAPNEIEVRSQSKDNVRDVSSAKFSHAGAGGNRANQGKDGPAAEHAGTGAQAGDFDKTDGIENS